MHKVKDSPVSPQKSNAGAFFLAFATGYVMKSKVGRLINSYTNKNKNRRGYCTPNACETLDGRKGAACCKLGYRCPALSGTACGIYKIRPRNCSVFPANEDDLKLVRNCGYRFD